MKTRIIHQRRCRPLDVDETVMAGDVIVTDGTPRKSPVHQSDFFHGKPARMLFQNQEAWRPVPKPDPMVVATLRARRRTNLGKLEALFVERAAARRRLTTALTALDLVEKSIAALAREQAQKTFAQDLTI